MRGFEELYGGFGQSQGATVLIAMMSLEELYHSTFPHIGASKVSNICKMNGWIRKKEAVK